MVGASSRGVIQPSFGRLSPVRAATANGGGAEILAEDAATVGATRHLDWVLRRAGLRDRVLMLWNASHPFGLELKPGTTDQDIRDRFAAWH
jgi:hypothetical protein